MSCLREQPNMPHVPLAPNVPVVGYGVRVMPNPLGAPADVGVVAPVVLAADTGSWHGRTSQLRRVSHGRKPKILKGAPDNPAPAPPRATQTGPAGQSNPTPPAGSHTPVSARHGHSRPEWRRPGDALSAGAANGDSGEIAAK